MKNFLKKLFNKDLIDFKEAISIISFSTYGLNQKLVAIKNGYLIERGGCYSHEYFLDKKEDDKEFEFFKSILKDYLCELHNIDRCDFIDYKKVLVSKYNLSKWLWEKS